MIPTPTQTPPDLTIRLPDPDTIRAAIDAAHDRARLLRRLLRLALRLRMPLTTADRVTTPDPRAGGGPPMPDPAALRIALPPAADQADATDPAAPLLVGMATATAGPGGPTVAVQEVSKRLGGVSWRDRRP